MFTLVGFGGVFVRVLRLGIPQSWNLFLFLSIVLAGIWVQTFLRGISSLIGPEIYLPPARYAYPVIIPTMLMLMRAGLNNRIFAGALGQLSPRVKLWVYALFFLGLLGFCL